MKYFKITYKVKNQTKTTVIGAESRVEAIKQFYDQKLGVMKKVEEVSEPITKKFEPITKKFEEFFKSNKVNEEKYIAILEQISIMLDAGLPLNLCIEESYKNTEDKMLKKIFAGILADIEKGMSLTEAASRYKKELGELSISLFQLGEETGTLSESIKKLSDILQEILDNRRKFKKATRYPLFVLIAMTIAFTIVIVFVVPQFEDFFKKSKLELPLPTKLLLWTEGFIVTFGPYVLSMGIVLAIGISILYNKSYDVRLKLDKMLLKVYIIGKATFYAYIVRFLYLLEVLNNAGVPLLEALNIAEGVVKNSYIKRQLDIIPSAVEEGRGLFEGFKESKLFESMVIEMVKAGEISGALGRMLNKASHVYKERFNYIVDNIASLIEPILIAAIAGFVLILALGIFLPMWNMIQTAM